MKDALLKLICETHRSRHGSGYFLRKSCATIKLFAFYCSQWKAKPCNFPATEPVACSAAPPSGCLLLCLLLSVLTLLLQNLWMPPDITRDDATGRSPQEHGIVESVICWSENVIICHTLTLVALYADLRRVVIWWGRRKVNVHMNQCFDWLELPSTKMFFFVSSFTAN